MTQLQNQPRSRTNSSSDEVINELNRAPYPRREEAFQELLARVERRESGLRERLERSLAADISPETRSRLQRILAADSQITARELIRGLSSGSAEERTAALGALNAILSGPNGVQDSRLTALTSMLGANGREAVERTCEIASLFLNESRNPSHTEARREHFRLLTEQSVQNLGDMPIGRVGQILNAFRTAPNRPFPDQVPPGIRPILEQQIGVVINQMLRHNQECLANPPGGGQPIPLAGGELLFYPQHALRALEALRRQTDPSNRERLNSLDEMRSSILQALGREPNPPSPRGIP